MFKVLLRWLSDCAASHSLDSPSLQSLTPLTLWVCSLIIQISGCASLNPLTLWVCSHITLTPEVCRVSLPWFSECSLSLIPLAFLSLYSLIPLTLCVYRPYSPGSLSVQSHYPDSLSVRRVSLSLPCLSEYAQIFTVHILKLSNIKCDAKDF